VIIVFGNIFTRTNYFTNVGL